MVPKKFKPSIIEQARDAIPITQVLSAIGWQPNRKYGAQWRGPCPFHGSRPKSVSLSVNVDRGVFYCHKCHAKGNVLNVYAHFHHMTTYEAAKELLNGK